MQTNAENPTGLLSVDAVPVGTPLEWPIVDGDGTLLFDRGAVLIGVDERKFLFDHFTPRRGDLADADNAADARTAIPCVPGPLTVKDMHLEIGALIGVRPQLCIGGRMHPCRIIGCAPNDVLFATPPVVEGRILPLSVGEHVDIVAITRHAVYRFLCTVEAFCRLPFDYIVLSKPSVIRRLRERKSIRVRTHLAVRYGTGETGDTYEGIGLAKDMSMVGMSLTTSWTLGQPGDRLRVAFRLRAKELDMRIETSAVIRNVRQGTSPGKSTRHGLNFDQLDAAQQMAMKAFVFERQEDVLHWT